MKFEKTTIPGCWVVIPQIKKDQRGHFVKTFHDPSFVSQGLCVQWKESFYTLSKKNVLRGLHFQVPPFDQDKLVTCVKGEIYDVVVDLRKGSPAFGHFFSLTLNEENGHQLFIPSGLAHGFLALSSETIVVYNVTSPYSPDHDQGLHWNSVSIPWPVLNPIVSERDGGFISLEKFNSPFIYNTHEKK